VVLTVAAAAARTNVDTLWYVRALDGMRTCHLLQNLSPIEDCALRNTAYIAITYLQIRHVCQCPSQDDLLLGAC